VKPGFQIRFFCIPVVSNTCLIAGLSAGGFNRSFMTIKPNWKTGLALVAGLCSTAVVHAEIRPNSLFSDNAVLQRDQSVPVWGTAREGEKVSVEFAGQKVSGVAKDGKWMVRLHPLAAGGPFDMVIAGEDNSMTLTNILVGDVWVASGQSNMQDPLGPSWWAAPVKNWQAEVAAANFPQIRQFKVPMVAASRPQADVDGAWSVCSPQTVPAFTAAGYFFARDLQQTTKAPVGILFSAWGGTVAEAWTSGESLERVPDFTNGVAAIMAADPAAYPRILADWYRTNDPGSAAQPAWSDPGFVASDWKTMKLPTYWQHADLPGFNGIVWFRKVIDLPAVWDGKGGSLHLDTIDDQDTTWVNGVQVGAMALFSDVRDYHVPAGVLKAGRNVISIRVLDTGGLGGICGRGKNMKLELAGSEDVAPVLLAGDWQYRATTALAKLPAVPANPAGNPNVPTVLYNAMVAPLVPFAMKGVVWYQGESNDDTDHTFHRTTQYRTLFPLLISDWRQHWGQGDFPFLFVQVAPYRDLTPRIREAQLMALKRTKNTAMVVLMDAGEAANIHPANKQVVGERLALAARALAYGEKIEYSGPIFKNMKVKGNKVVLQFDHVGAGLLAKDGELKGFVVAGADKAFVPAQAEIVGKTVVVSSGQVAAPAAVRYGWENIPDVNLFNQAGLPASPFRTDVD
jgi:sialate O-acetylesterase